MGNKKAFENIDDVYSLTGITCTFRNKHICSDNSIFKRNHKNTVLIKIMIFADGMSGYLTAAGGYYAPAMTAQQLAGLGAHAGNPGLAAYAAAAPPTVSQAATAAAAEARIQ